MYSIIALKTVFLKPHIVEVTLYRDLSGVVEEVGSLHASGRLLTTSGFGLRAVYMARGGRWEYCAQCRWGISVHQGYNISR